MHSLKVAEGDTPAEEKRTQNENAVFDFSFEVSNDALFAPSPENVMFK